MNENDYIVDAFTRKGDNTNLEVNNLKVGCITSKDNNFELDSNGNLTVKSLFAEEIAITSQAILNVIYPVGSIYISVGSINPENLFGGSWEQIKDRFLLASGDTFTAGSIGGEVAHAININEMPHHAHTLMFHSHDGTGNSGTGIPYYGNGNSMIGGDASGCQPSGNGAAHNNMPPYLTVYMWKRIG